MNWSSFDSILFTLDKVILITYFVILVLAVLVERKVSSFVITVIVLTVANSVMTSLSPVMYQFSSQPGLIAKFSWYAGFALIDMMALFLLYKFHQLLNQNVCYVAQLVGMLFLAFATLQTARFIDRFVFHTDLLQQVYKYAIPVLNVTLVPIIVFFWLSEMRRTHRYTRMGTVQ
ncbi:hypothetical protein ORJ04_00250 [Rheinheimera baltica]|uniref:Rod shape-determining protein MreD n=1 Tax=Rheinheimera baltica TaxID=67576 RepID=A0ABT9HTC7_9GAMM|nr:hypothetical protein [Rheinheimera baltica]MDP5134377.1 hypothetical protein [Rheinheimera baltica]MDP5141206.1 hypothetical protein [Rheinheimera baltica]MDP5148437.1 hypothetical protein [Rheinheimera baltica]